jgi:hypothetical protein
MEKLESGYTREQLKEFSREAFRAKKAIRKTPDGSWETYVVTATEPPRFDETTATQETTSDVQKKEKKGFWRRLLSGKQRNS